jgi:NADH dehydrogenase/NADH:ubiquinone oxidoreductase subunit G
MAETDTIDILIDGRRVQAQPGETVLSVAERNNIEIPNLCHHEALVPTGACRLCLVEIGREGGLEGERDIVASCQYPVSEGLRVQTQSERVRRHRRVVASLLYSRAPHSGLFKRLTDALGGAIDYRESQRKDNCILCTLCSRTCAAVGAHAISPSGRGYDKQIAPPFIFGEGGCVGCGACARVCPTGCIEMVDTLETRTIWSHEFAFVKCETCGAPTVTREHMALAMARSGLPEHYFSTCVSCKQKASVATFADLSEPFGVGE